MQLSQPTSFRNDFTIQSFFRRLNEEGRLAGAVCRDCNSKMLPPRPVCSKCFSSNLELFDLPRRGKLVGFSEVHVTNDAFRGFVPYLVGIVEFENSVKVPGMIKGVQLTDLSVGVEVHVNVRTPSPSASDASEIQGDPAYWFTVS